MSLPGNVCRAGLASTLALMLCACAPMSYQVKEPAVSSLKYELPGTAPVTQLKFVDERRGDETIFSTGTLPATLTLAGGPLDAMSFLTKNVAAELNSRGVPTTTADAAGTPVVHVKTFRIQNHRSNGFTPFFTSTYLSADVETADGLRRVAAYVRRGKVPVWSFDEVIDPTFNQPLSLAVKEFSAKLAAAMYSCMASDATVQALVAKATATPTADTFLDVYALGFTNNPLATDTLVGLTKSPDEYVRLAAISSLGNLRATSQFALLKSIYEDGAASRQDRDMALKSIADLGNADSEAFIRAEIKSLAAQNDVTAQWTSRMLALYL